MAPEFRFVVSTEDAALVENVKIRASANRQSLATRTNDTGVEDQIVQKVSQEVPSFTAGGPKKGASRYTRLEAPRRDLVAFRRIKGGNILYIFIFDENDGQSPTATDYEDFIAVPLYKEVFNGCLAQVPLDSGSYFPAVPIKGWDQPVLQLPTRNASGLYQELEDASEDFPTLKNIPDYSILYFVIDSSGSMDVDTVQVGVQQFFQDLIDNKRKRPTQHFLFQDSDLADSVSIPGQSNTVSNWFNAQDLESYLDSIGRADAYRDSGTALIFVSNDGREQGALPAIDFFEWLGDEELAFYKAAGAA